MYHIIVKEATEFYFIYYSRVVSILFSTDFCKSAFSTHSFGKARFSSFMLLYLWLLIFNFALCLLYCEKQQLYNVSCAFAYFCGGHKNNFGL